MRINALLATLTVATAIAGLSGASVSAQSQNQTENQTPKQANVVVQPGDNLSKIASAHATTYVRLYDANTQIAHPDIIHPGDNIRIPNADEQLASRPLPSDAQVPADAVVQPAVKNTGSKAKAALPSVSASSGSTWDRLAQCEAGGNWSANTGNGYYGGLQFSASSWRAVGGSGLPSQASKSEQIARAEMLKARQGWGAWPSCSAKLGLR
jgi:hypothetical protein